MSDGHLGDLLRGLPEYDALAVGLRKAVEADPSVFSAERLQGATAADVRGWLAPHDVPEAEERAEMLREVRPQRAQPTRASAPSPTAPRGGEMAACARRGGEGRGCDRASRVTPEVATALRRCASTIQRAGRLDPE